MVKISRKFQNKCIKGKHYAEPRELNVRFYYLSLTGKAGQTKGP